MNQNRLFEGQWAIVSTYVDGIDVSDAGFVNTVYKAAFDGVPVEVLSGTYAGIPEQALLLRGPRAAMRAKEIARECSQESYILAGGNGEAYLLETGSERVLQVFTSMHELSNAERLTAENYSVTGYGLAFQLR